MKLNKKLLATLLATALAISACGKTTPTEDTKTKEETTKAAEASTPASEAETTDTDKKVKIGVLQLVEHGSLDQAYEGFKAGLAEAGYTDVEYSYQNAQNGQENLKSMSEKLAKEKPELILAIATPAAQSLANETQTIPIVGTAITDYVEAKLVESNEKPGKNITGTSDMVPIEKQIKLLLSLAPDAKTIGIMYNGSEANSKIQADLAKIALEEAGVEVKVLTANSTNDVQQVTESLAKNTDGIYIPTDNTFAAAAALVGQIAKETKTPVVAGAIDQVEQGGLATFGIDYYSLGKQAGAMAAKILKGENPADLPIETAKDLELYVNDDMAEALDIDPASIKVPD